MKSSEQKEYAAVIYHKPIKPRVNKAKTVFIASVIKFIINSNLPRERRARSAVSHIAASFMKGTACVSVIIFLYCLCIVSFQWLITAQSKSAPTNWVRKSRGESVCADPGARLSGAEARWSHCVTRGVVTHRSVVTSSIRRERKGVFWLVEFKVPCRGVASSPHLVSHSLESQFQGRPGLVVCLTSCHCPLLRESRCHCKSTLNWNTWR